MLVVVFLKIRQSFCVKEIVFCFGVHPSMISRTFHHVLDVMYIKTKILSSGLITTLYRKPCQYCFQSSLTDVWPDVKFRAIINTIQL